MSVFGKKFTFIWFGIFSFFLINISHAVISEEKNCGFKFFSMCPEFISDSLTCILQRNCPKKDTTDEKNSQSKNTLNNYFNDEFLSEEFFTDPEMKAPTYKTNMAKTLDKAKKTETKSKTKTSTKETIKKEETKKATSTKMTEEEMKKEIDQVLAEETSPEFKKMVENQNQQPNTTSQPPNQQNPTTQEPKQPNQPQNQAGPQPSPSIQDVPFNGDFVCKKNNGGSFQSSDRPTSQGGKIANELYQAAENAAKASGAKVKVISGFRPGARVAGSGHPSKHGFGQALDVNIDGSNDQKTKFIVFFMANTVNFNTVGSYAGKMSHTHLGGDCGSTWCPFGARAEPWKEFAFRSSGLSQGMRPSKAHANAGAKRAAAKLCN